MNTTDTKLNNMQLTNTKNWATGQHITTSPGV